ncbi:MAG: TRAP transporter small permease subunit [Elusimicrobiales bacterium]|nr:TRAP transporter small permease subunit [Elusimicrobiales bacterium]
MIKLVLKSEEWLVKSEKGAVTLLVALMVSLSFLQLALRLAFSRSILWLDPLLRHFVLWTGFFGAALAAHEGKHFALDAAQKLLPGKARRGAEIICALFTAAVCALLLAAGAAFIKDEMASGSAAFSVGNFAVASWWLELALPLGFLLILFHTLAGLLRAPQTGSDSGQLYIPPQEADR